MAKHPDATVIVREGEKAADAAQGLFSDCVATTPPNGAQSPRLADWGSLKGRKVRVWPDYDKPGCKFTEAVERLVLKAGAIEVRVIDPQAFRVLPDGTERDIPEKWDAADAVAEGFTANDAARLAKGFLVAPPWGDIKPPAGYRFSASGVETVPNKVRGPDLGPAVF